MKKKLKFSIIVPNFNKGEYIKDCLDSIYCQNYKNYEVIVIDDGSSDNSCEELKKYNLDYFLHTNRKGAGGARNEGLKFAQGDYIIFLDSDDYLTDNSVLEKLNSLINDEDLIFLNFTRNEFGKIIEVNEEKEDISLKIENTRKLGCPTKCFKRELIEDIRFPECKRYEDIIFTLTALCKAKSYTYFNYSFFTYRKVQQSNTTLPIDANTILDIIQEIINIYRLCIRYPKYKDNLLTRIKNDKIPLRLEILNKLLETGENNYRDYF